MLVNRGAYFRTGAYIRGAYIRDFTVYILRLIFRKINNIEPESKNPTFNEKHAWCLTLALKITFHDMGYRYFDLC